MIAPTVTANQRSRRLDLGNLAGTSIRRNAMPTKPTPAAKIRQLLPVLTSTIHQMEEASGGRPFALQGQVLGSIGEVIAAEMFGLDLKHPDHAAATGMDATWPGHPTRKSVAIELTLTDRVTRSCHSTDPHQLIVLAVDPWGGPITVAYNGPAATVWEAIDESGIVTLDALALLQRTVPEAERLPPARDCTE